MWRKTQRWSCSKVGGTIRAASVTLALTALLLLGTLYSIVAWPASVPATVATIEGAALTESELALFVAWRRADIAARLFPGESALGAQAWQRRVDGRKAADVLKAAAVSDAIDAKLLQVLAVEHRLLADASWTEFERALAEENTRRAATIARGEPIYGPRAFGAPQFYRKRLNDLSLRLARKLSDTGNQTAYERVAALVASRRATARLEVDARRLEAFAVE